MSRFAGRSPAEWRGAVEAALGDGAATARELAARLGCHVSSVYDPLAALEGRGRVTSERVQGKLRRYRVPPREETAA